MYYTRLLGVPAVLAFLPLGFAFAGAPWLLLSPFVVGLICYANARSLVKTYEERSMSVAALTVVQFLISLFLVGAGCGVLIYSFSNS